MSPIWTPRKIMYQEWKYCEKCAEPKYEREDNHECRGEYCFYCNEKHKTGDKQKCKEYEKEKEIPNKMAEQKCDVYEAKRIFGITRGKTYPAITKEKKEDDNRQNQRKKEETKKVWERLKK